MNRCPFMATYRCFNENAQKIEIKIRTTEGQFGSLNIYVVPKGKNIISQAIEIPIKPLNLHEKINEIEEKDVKMSSILISGNFSKLDMHTWISMCIPNVPPASEDD